MQEKKILVEKRLPPILSNPTKFQPNTINHLGVLITICSKHKNKKQWKKVVLFLSDMKFCFFKRLASVLEETMSVAQPHLGKPESLLIGARRKQSEEVSSSGGSSLEFWDSSEPEPFV
jgi:hypothetical protein